MIKILFPYLLQLHIFQLDEYNLGKFLRWIFSHFLIRTIENKKKLVLTSKAKGILYLSLFFAALAFLLLSFFFGVIGAVGGIILATQAYIFLTLADLILLPYETFKKRMIVLATENKLASFPRLKIIGITGSYGKTSVKEFLYQILKTKHAVLRTPESYNTPLGIAKVVDLELDNSYEYFLCEMGAYRRGEIKEICDMVHPKYGILTGINEQHLETFGSLENTIKGKFELIDALPESGLGVVNGDNALIQQALLMHEKKIITYGFADKKFAVQDVQQKQDGTSFALVLDGKKYEAKTKLLGKSNIQNILGAATMSYLLGMKPQAIVAAIADIAPVAHRLEVKNVGNMTLIDDAYNSNVDGFQEAITLLSSYARPKILVTPGIVDLGARTLTIHESLGKLLDAIDYVFLVGNSERTRGLRMGIKNKNKIIELASIKDVWKKLEDLDLENPVVLLENDLPDNY